MYLPDLTVNEAEYQGLLLGFDLLSSLDRGRLIICGDSNLVIRQMRGEIECKAPGLTPLRRRALDRRRTWPAHEFLHVKRDWNQSADRSSCSRRTKDLSPGWPRRLDREHGRRTRRKRYIWTQFNASGRTEFCERRTRRSG
ncbi:hypothetical protein F443_16358 [Phytophthora nicotianae P1569]|uniref:RNase H type-1 domain-containing protein n=1 Tax=Phytophthora nicotianae P1569 TaxID=1317065 RepID=V9EFM1_PHYNI|nr:hypothetical protein F443_16358 [Phytophthora nicotianae P1569]